MTRALIVVLAFDLATMTPRIGMPMLMPQRAPEALHPQMPVNNRFGRRRAAKFARLAA